MAKLKNKEVMTDTRFEYVTVELFNYPCYTIISILGRHKSSLNLVFKISIREALIFKK